MNFVVANCPSQASVLWDSELGSPQLSEQAQAARDRFLPTPQDLAKTNKVFVGPGTLRKGTAHLEIGG